MPRIVELEKSDFRTLPPGQGTTRRLTVRADEIQSHGLDLKSLLTPQGFGLIWAAMEAGVALPRAKDVSRPHSTIVQVTNLGITVKDSPQSTLVFVTRLDNGAAGRRRARDRSSTRATSKCGAARRIATASRWRRRCRLRSARQLVRALVRRHRRERRRLRLRRVELERRHHAVGLRPSRISCGRRPTSCADRSSPIAASTNRANRFTSRRSSGPTRRQASGCCRPDRRSTSACTTAATRKSIAARSRSIAGAAPSGTGPCRPTRRSATTGFRRWCRASEPPEGNDATGRRRRANG